jgi:hypothetical protein
VLPRLALTLAALALAGCHTHHYVVLEEAPLYADARGDRVLATLPRYHHEALREAPETVAGRVALGFRGRRGYAPRSAVRLFRYLDPGWDGGEEKRAAIRDALRDAQVRAEGSEWSAGVQDAVRRGEVHAGMTRQQVELAWGWPLTVEPDPRSGGERWIYRTQRTETLHRFLSDPFSYPSASLSLGYYGRSYGCERFAGRYGTWAWPRSGWVELRLEVTEERTVVIDPDGEVLGVRIRRYLNDA